MKKVFLLLALLPTLAPTLAYGSPALPSSGKYAYRGHFSVLQLRRAELVRTNTDAGRNRLAKLRAEGKECMGLQPDAVRCVGFEPTEGTETQVAEQLNRSLRGASLNIGIARGTPSLTTKAPSYEEWLVPQSIQFLGQAWDSYRYVTLRGELSKLVFGNPAETGVVLKGGNFGFITTINRQPHRDIVLTYFLEAELSN